MKKQQLLPIGTKVYIRDDSEYFQQGVKNGEKLIGIITDHTSHKYLNRDFLYEIEWIDGYGYVNTYQGCDIEPIEIIEEQEVNEEEINNELKQLFNQILNN